MSKQFFPKFYGIADTYILIMFAKHAEKIILDQRGEPTFRRLIPFVIRVNNTTSAQLMHGLVKGGRSDNVYEFDSLS